MSIQLPPLPYPKTALAPYISEETLEYHHGKHHQTYVDNLNKLLPGSGLEGLSLEEIIKKSQGGLFNNAAQVWNHTFYWHCLSPETNQSPQGALSAAIDKKFGSFAEFQQQFTQTALTTFGSGWAWLIKKADGEVDLLSTSNAQCPLTQNLRPLLTCDVWEHAYYVDYRNARAKYLEAFWKITNWRFVESQFA